MSAIDDEELRRLRTEVTADLKAAASAFVVSRFEMRFRGQTFFVACLDAQECTGAHQLEGDALFEAFICAIRADTSRAATLKPLLARWLALAPPLRDPEPLSIGMKAVQGTLYPRGLRMAGTGKLVESASRLSLPPVGCAEALKTA